MQRNMNFVGKVDRGIGPRLPYRPPVGQMPSEEGLLRPLFPRERA
jgi:hypothetical protein